MPRNRCCGDLRQIALPRQGEESQAADGFLSVNLRCLGNSLGARPCSGKHRLTLQEAMLQVGSVGVVPHSPPEAMKDAKKSVLRERRHQQQITKELQDLGQDEDVRICEVEFLVGRATSKELRKLNPARRFPKFLAKVKKLQVSEQRRFSAASVGHEQRLPAPVANGVLKYW